MLGKRKWLALAVSVSLLLGTTPGAQGLLFALEEPAIIIRKIKSFLEVGLEELNGLVLYSDERTPVADAPVRVWSTAENKFVYETTTDEKGAFKIPVLPEGFYYVVFGDRVIVEVFVDASVRPVGQPLWVIAPRGKPALTPAQISRILAEPTGAGRGLLRGIIIMTAGGAVAVGVLGLTGAFKEKEKKVIVSP